MPNKRRLFIVGAGDLGRDLENWLDMVPLENRDWAIAGYLHSGDSHLHEFPTEYEVVGDWNDFEFKSDDLCIIAVASQEWKHKIANYLDDKVEFLNFIHPSVIMNKFVSLGKGVILCPNVVISCNAKIGDHVLINCGSQIGHDVEIGDFSSVMSSVDLAGYVKIGKDVTIGSNAVIVPKKKVGDNSVVGAGSVVVRNVKENITVFGNPAKKIGSFK